MLQPSIIQQRAKHFDFLLARELSQIERQHSHNLIAHQKLENSIRRTKIQSSNNNRTKFLLPLDNIYTERSDSIDYHRQHRLSFDANSGGSSNNSNGPHQASIDHFDDFCDDTWPSISLRPRRCCTKVQRLPPIIKENKSNQSKLENKNLHWRPKYRRENLSQENINEPFTISNEDISKSNSTELSPLQKQVRSFLDTLPTYQGAQHGFDSFAPASLYTNRTPLAIR